MTWQVLGLLALGFKYYPETLSYVARIGEKAVEISGVAARALLQLAVQYMENNQRLRLQQPPCREEFQMIEGDVVELTEEQLAKILNSNERIPVNFRLVEKQNEVN